MEYRFSSLNLYIANSNTGRHTIALPKGSYTIGVTAVGNEIVINYWEPVILTSSPKYVTLELLIVTNNYVLQDYKITPNRLRNLGHVAINNGDTLYHVFEIQSELFHPHNEFVE